MPSIPCEQNEGCFVRGTGRVLQMVLRAELPAARTAHTEDTLTGLNDAVTPSGLIFKHDSIYGLISKHVSPSSSPARASKTILPHHWPLYLQDEVSQIGSSLLNGGSGNQVHSQTASTTECPIQVPKHALLAARVSMARKWTGVPTLGTWYCSIPRTSSSSQNTVPYPHCFLRRFHSYTKWRVQSTRIYKLCEFCEMSVKQTTPKR